MNEIVVEALVENVYGEDVEADELQEHEEVNEERDEREDLIGMVVHRVEGLGSGYFPRRPFVVARVVEEDGQLMALPRSDERLQPCSTKKFFICDQRCLSFGNDMLVLDAPFTQLKNKRLLLFDLMDMVSTFVIRIAWAFLKPIAADGSSNTNSLVRLQLYKPAKSCKLNHLTCDVFHLYAAHKRKKYPGCLCVTIKGVKKPSGHSPELRADTRKEEEERPEDREVVKEGTVELEMTRWSRLPGQSCKIPNFKRKEFYLGRHGASCVAFNHKGLQMAVASFGLIKLFNVVSGEEQATLGGHSGLVYEVSYMADDRLLLSVSGDSTALVWAVDPISSDPVALLPHPSFVYCGRWSQTGGQIATGCKDHIVRCWTRTQDSFVLADELTGHSGFVSALLTNGDDVIISGDSNGCVLVRRLQEGDWTVVKRLQHRDIVGHVIDTIHLHGGGRRVVLTVRSKGCFLVDISAGVAVHSYRAPISICARCVSALTPCGSFLWTFSQNNVINVWDVNTGKLVADLEAVFSVTCANDPGGCVTYHPHEHMVAVAVFGCGLPLTLLEFNNKIDHSAKLGITLREVPQTSEVHKKKVPSPALRSVPLKNKVDEGGDKLARLVRKIDNVLAAKKSLQSSFETN